MDMHSVLLGEGEGRKVKFTHPLKAEIKKEKRKLSNLLSVLALPTHLAVGSLPGGEGVSQASQKVGIMTMDLLMGM